MATDNADAPVPQLVCPVCGLDLSDINIRAHHDSHFDLRTPIQNWSEASRAHSDQLLAMHRERSA